MRTEKEVLKDFRKLGYQVQTNNKTYLKLCHFYKNEILSDRYYFIYKQKKEYKAMASQCSNFTMQEHKLLNELFSIWGWL